LRTCPVSTAKVSNHGTHERDAPVKIERLQSEKAYINGKIGEARFALQTLSRRWANSMKDDQWLAAELMQFAREVKELAEKVIANDTAI